MMPGMVPVIAGGADRFSLEYLGYHVTTNSGTSQSVSSVPLGGGGSNVSLLIFVASVTNVSVTTSALTVGGQPASKQVEHSAGSNGCVSIWSMAHPGGATGTVTITASSSSAAISCFAIWRVVGLTSLTAVDTGTDTSLDLNMPSRSVAIAATAWCSGSNPYYASGASELFESASISHAISVSRGTNSATWTGLDEDFDDAYRSNGGSTSRYRAVSAAFA